MVNRWLTGALAYTWLVVTCLAPVAAQEPPKPPAGGPGDPPAGAPADKKSEFTLSLDGAPLEDIIELVSDWTNKVFLFPDRMKSIKIYSKGRRAFRGEDLFVVFQSVLELNGFALVTIARDTPAEVIKIVDARNTRRYDMPTYSAKELTDKPGLWPVAEEVITVTYGLKHASAREVSNALRPLLDANMGGQIIGIEKVEVLVLTDYAPNVKRLVRVIELMDVPGPQLRWEVVALQWADPDDLVGKIGQFMEGQIQAQQQQQGQQGPQVRLVSYSRTRSIIVQATEEYMRQVKELIRTLDVKILFEPSRLHLHKLKHTEAEKLAETVNAVLTATPNLGAEADTPPAGGPPGPAGPGPRSPGSPTTPRRAPRTGSGLDNLQDRATAIADKATNSLIVVAAESEWKEIQKIITQLDVRRPQVLIEAAIIEVTSSDTLNFGTELSLLDSPAKDSTRGFGATAFGLSSLVDANGVPVTAQTPGVPAGRIPNTDSQGVVWGLTRDTPFRIPLLINLIGTASETNVLSFPRLLTNDNEEASVSVGESVPTSTLQNVGQAGIAPTSSFGGFQDAKMVMKVTPHISEGDYLNLELSLTIDQFTGASTNPALPPPKATREITNRITIPNHQTIIIGGLTSSRLIQSTTKIPFLGDIPLLGLLFQRQDTRETKTHLFIFLTPHIFTDGEFRDIGRISAAHLEDVRTQGVNPAAIDEHYRRAFADETWPGAEEGLPPVRLAYRSGQE